MKAFWAQEHLKSHPLIYVSSPKYYSPLVDLYYMYLLHIKKKNQLVAYLKGPVVCPLFMALGIVLSHK